MKSLLLGQRDLPFFRDIKVTRSPALVQPLIETGMEKLAILAPHVITAIGRTDVGVNQHSLLITILDFRVNLHSYSMPAHAGINGV